MAVHPIHMQDGGGQCLLCALGVQPSNWDNEQDEVPGRMFNWMLLGGRLHDMFSTFGLSIIGQTGEKSDRVRCLGSDVPQGDTTG